MPNSLARKTISEIEKALDEQQTTAISEIIKIIQELASRAFSISIAELSQLIGRDPTITEKVISAANTLGFNPSGIAINTISEAIHTVGFEKIRNLAISLMLAENAGQKLNNYEQREIAALSVCSGMMAQTLANDEQRSIDPELIFVCSSLRNYGKLLMSTFLVEQFREAKSLALGMEDDEAYRQVFGLTPMGLGRYLLQSTTLPKSIMLSLREVPKEVIEKAAQSEDEEVLLLAELSVKICEIAFNEHIGPEAFNGALLDVLQRFQRSMPISLESVNQAILQVEESFSMLNRAIGLSDDASPATLKLRARTNGENLPTPPPDSRIKAVEAPKAIADMNPKERDVHAESLFEKAVAEITQKLIPGSKVDLREVYETAAKAIMEGLDLENCMVFVREEFDSEKLSARFGFGPLFSKIRNRPLVSAKNGDIFSICLNRKEDILIQDIGAGKIRSVMPTWITDNSSTHSLIILPTLLEKKLIGIILGTVQGTRTIQLNDSDLRRLRVMRMHLATLAKMVQEQDVSLK